MTWLPSSTTPIIPGFYPDPTICRVGDEYFLANSSFEYFPGAPLFHSVDLVNWRQIGNILTRRSQFRRGDGRPSAGIYGSTLRHRDGRFWFITTNVSDHDAGQILVHADDPAGEWSDPVFIDAVGIDPDLAWDDDGRPLLTWKGWTPEGGDQAVLQAPVDLSTGELLATPYPVWQGTGLMAPEAPHLYRVGDFWYLMLAEGGTERGHCVTVARGLSPTGPFTPCPANPIFTRRSTAFPVQSVGHADLVETPDGRWAAVYLGTRPRGFTPAFHVLGRETFLAGVDWVDGWPRFDPDRFSVPASATGFFDDFADGRLNLRWVVPGGEPTTIARPHPAGGLAVRGAADGSSELLCTRVRDLAWTAEAEVRGAGQLRLMIDSRHWCAVSVADGLVEAQASIGDSLCSLGQGHIPGIVRVRVESRECEPVAGGNAGPDKLRLSAAGDDDVWHPLGEIDGRYLSTEVAGGFTGRMLAVGSSGPAAHIGWVRYWPAQT